MQSQDPGQSASRLPQLRWRAPLAVIVPLVCCLPLFAADVPSTARHPVTNLYHGVAVADDYRWLENASDPQVKTWVAQQNAYTASILNRSKLHDSVRRELTHLLENRPTVYRSV